MVKFKNGDPVPIVEVKKVFSHGFYEPEYTVKLKDGRLYKANEGQFTVANSDPRSTNPVVANALKAAGVARNADESIKIKVVAETETIFGKERKEGAMTIGQLKAAFAKIGHARLFSDVERNFDAGKGGDVCLSLPCEVYFTRA